MYFVENCEQYAYTKIIVPITLPKAPSDYDDSIYYLDINEDDFCQKNCFIGTQKIEEIIIKRVRKADCEHEYIAEWQLEIIIAGGKCEEEIITILDELCVEFSLKISQCYKYFQYCGFEGFDYDRLRLKRKYAHEDKVFSDTAMSMYCGKIEMTTISSIENNVFKLPQKAKIPNEYKGRFIAAFLRALRCKDKISRYILLYYLFEIMYSTPEYQQLKNNFKPMSGTMNGNKKRSLILFQYLQQEFNLYKYSSLGKKISLDVDALEKIIITRNDLTHRGDATKVSNLMYYHLLPILQEVIRKM